MATSDREHGTTVAGEITRELNELLEHASEDVVEQHIVDARNRVTELADTDITRALSECEQRLEYACQTTDNDDLEYDVRQLRQAIVGLVDDNEVSS